MLTFVAEYWLEFLFGLVAAGAVAMAKRFRDLYIKEQKHQKKKEEEELKQEIQNDLLSVINKNRKESKEDDIRIEKHIQAIDKEIKILKSGILAIYGNNFKKECRRLLEKDNILIEEMDSLSEEYQIYHSLGGNHDGDRLYKDVSIKYRSQLDK